MRSSFGSIRMSTPSPSMVAAPWEITGGQPAGSPFGVDLEAVARGCGFGRTSTVDTLEDFRAVFAEAMADRQSWVIVGRIAAGDSPYRPDKSCVALRDRFATSLLPPPG